jgi:hypothetical protein
MSKGQNILKDIFTPSTDEIAQGYIINSWHVSQSVVALTGAENYDISVSGSFTVSGSIYQEDPTSFPPSPSGIYNIVVRSANTGEYILWQTTDENTSGQVLRYFRLIRFFRFTSGSSGSSGIRLLVQVHQAHLVHPELQVHQVHQVHQALQVIVVPQVHQVLVVFRV